MKDKEGSDPITPKWLKTIQLNSWEAELLVSALVLYALFQIPDWISVFSLKTIPRDSQLQGFFNILISAVKLMKIGYILHILVRGIWVASVGLSYVFPEGINKEQLKFKGKFRKELESSTSIVKNVLRLEELSSLIYGVSFLIFGALLGFGTFIFSFIYAFELIGPLMEDNFYMAGAVGILVLFYVFLSLIVFIDFLTNGYFRRKNWSVDWFYPVAVIFRVVTLSFLYRRSLLVLISNARGWKSYLIPIIIFGIIFCYNRVERKFQSENSNNYLMASEDGNYLSVNYENTRSNDDFLIATIQSDIVEQNTLRLFLKDQKIFSTLHSFDLGGKARWKSLETDIVSERLNKWVVVMLDSTRIDNVKWFKSQHPSDYKFGFISFIDINSFPRGEHNLIIKFDTTQMTDGAKSKLVDEDYDYDYLANIHFVYDK